MSFSSSGKHCFFSYFRPLNEVFLFDMENSLFLCYLTAVLIFLNVHQDSAARFTQHPPSVLYVQTGKTARFVWDYTVDNRNTELSLNSPVWGVYDSNNRRAIIGIEDGLNGWKWTISSQCPARLLNPTVRVSKESTATLVISSVTTADSGIYECRLELLKGSPITSKVHLVVTDPPKIDVSKSTSSSKSWNGSNIRLKCFATGLPSPQISWYKPTNQHITTGVNILPGGSEVTVLTTTDQGDYGQYKCRATNIVGSDEHIINITQLFPPGPVDLTITEIEASSITVRWTKPANDGGSPVTGYLMEISTKPQVITVNNQAVITGLKANTQYTVKVTARNIVNYGQASIKVITTKKQGKPALPELTVTLSQTPELSVKLRWTKPDDNGGEITKYTIYMMEGNASEWTKIDDILDPTVLEYAVTKDIEHCKTYKFIVTAWNKYGESTKYGGISKEIPGKKSTNCNTSKANDCSCEKDSKCK